MTTTKVVRLGRDGQLAIPKAIRDALGQDVTCRR